MIHQRKPQKASPRLVVYLLLLLAVATWNYAPVSSGAGCATPQFGPNPPNTATGIQPRSFVIGDFNNDGKKDLATANYGTELGQPNGSLSILLNNGSGGFLPAVHLSAWR